MHLLTERLVIRRFRPTDAMAFAAYRSDPDVARYQSWTPPVALSEAEHLVSSFAIGDPDAPGWFQYAIESRADGVLVGDIGVALHENRRQAEIGFTIALEWQGRGHAFEALSRLLENLFADRGLHRLSAECDARNAPSARLLEKLSFTREGLRPQHTWIKGEWTDDLLYGLLFEDWQATQRPGSG